MPNPNVQAWATAADLVHPCSDTSGYDAAELAAVLDAATYIVWSLSGRRYPGLVSETLVPCADNVHGYRTASPSLDPGPVYGGVPWSYPTSWIRWRCPHRAVDVCGCARLHQIDLGVYPLDSIEQVVIDGATVDPSAYRVDDYRYLVRLDGDPWPSCADLTDPDSFAVTCTWGLAPPAAGVQAVAALACQMLLARDPASAAECRLPRRATNVVRQGISVTVMDPFEFLDDGKVGVYEVDLFIKSANPNGLRRPSRVASPDRRGRSRRVGTWTPGS